jgi:poly(A) polymerase
MNWQPKQPAFRVLLKAFLEQTTPLYVVGGVVRDYLLAQQNDKTDLDLVVEQAALPIARRVADRLGWAYYPLDEGRDVARLVFAAGSGEPLVCDVASMRDGSLEADLRARDFTINAMAFAVTQREPPHLIDPYGGQRDLAQRLIRRVTATSLAEDPVRMLRAVRLSRQLAFAIEEETLIQIKRMSTTVKLASAERVRDELWKILTSHQPEQAIEDLRQFNLLPHVLPEVGLTSGVQQSAPHYQDVYAHMLRTVHFAVQLRNWIAGIPAPLTNHQQQWQTGLAPWRARLRQHFAQPLAVGRSRLDWLVWHALLHDIGKPATRSTEPQPDGSVRIRFLEHEQASAALIGERLSQLRFNRPEIALAQASAAGHMRPHQLHAAFRGQPISRRACYRFFRDVGGKQFSQLAGVDTIMLALADLQAIYPTTPPDWAGYLTHANELLTFAFAQDGLTATQQKPLLDGHTLMEYLQLAPSRQVGVLLEAVLEAQAAGEIQTADEALQLASRRLAEDKNDQSLARSDSQ